MLKFREIGTYKNAVNVGYCVATEEMHNGQIVVVDESAKEVAFPETVTDAGMGIVMSRIEKPEIATPNDYVVEVGEMPRVFMLSSLKGRIIDMDMDQVTGTGYSKLSVGDYLIAKTDGKLEKTSDPTSTHKEYFQIVEKTGFGGEGLAVKVFA